MRKNKKFFITFICILIFVMVSMPTLSDMMYMDDGHDTLFHTQRILSIKHALESGQFPVRIYTESYKGYGYGSPLFYPELFLYFPAILCLLGMPIVLSYNIFLLLVNGATIALAWYSFSKITESKEIGLVAMILYVTCSYRMFGIYVRGSVGEILALTFCPLALYGLHLFAKGMYGKWWILALAFSGLLQSHILTFVLMVMIAAGYVAFHYKEFFHKKAMLALCKAAGLAVLLNAWFLVPFLEASRLEVIAMRDNDGFFNTGASLIQMFDMLLFSINGWETWEFNIALSLPKTPGITLIAGAVLASLALVLCENKPSESQKKSVKYLAAGLFFAWMVTNLFPWKIIEKIHFLNSFFSKFRLAWRFNIGAVLFLSVAAAYGIYYFFIQDAANKKKALALVSFVLLGFPVIFYNQYVKQVSLLDSEAVIQRSYMDDLYVVPGFNYESREDITSNLVNAVYTGIEKKECEISFYFESENGVFRTDLADKTYIEVPITHYPGYTVLIDGKEAEYTCGSGGVIRIWLPEDCTEGFIKVFFDEPSLWTVANVISCVTGIGFFTYIILQKKKERNFGG